MRSYRYQLVALLVAAGIFLVSLVVRLAQTPSTPSLPPTQPTAPTATEVIVEVSVSATPMAIPTIMASADGIPTYREAIVGEVSRLNPLLALSNPVDRDITSLIFEGLTTTNGYGEPIPALASHWVISSDGLEYTVFLRDDVLWQDGLPLTSADVLYTMSLLRSPDFPGPEALYEFWRTVETEALSDKIVRFRLTQPLGVFPEHLQIGILPEHALRGTGAAQLAAHPFNLSPIGTGPYQLETIHTDGSQITEVSLRASPNYRLRPEGEGGLPTERITFKLFGNFQAAVAALAQGDVDGLSASGRDDREALFVTANDQNLAMQNQIENSLGVLLFNWQSETATFFHDQRVRTALAAGLDRDTLIERTLGLENAGVLANSPLMPGSWAYDAELPWPSYDQNYARNLLGQAAARIERQNSTGEETPSTTDSGQIAPGALPTATPTATPIPTNLFEFAILTPDDPQLVALAQEIAHQWSQLGLAVTVDAVNAETYRQRLNDGQFDTAIAEYALGDSADPDVYSFWNEGQYPDGENYAGVDDLRISVLLERARRDPWGVNRARDYEEFQREFAERVVALPLYYPIFTYVTSPRLEGLQLGFIGTPSDRFRNVENWRLVG